MFPSRKTALGPFLLVAVVVLAVFVVVRSGKPVSVATPSSDDTSRAASSEEANPPPPRTWPTPFSVDIKELPPKDALPPGTLRVLVVGDSVASFLGLALRYRQDEAKSFVAARGVGDCNIFASKPYVEKGKTLISSSCSTRWADDAAELHPDVTLIVMGGGFFQEKACEKPWQATYEQRIHELSDAMGPSAGLVVLTRVPYPIKSWRHGNVLKQVDCFNAMLVSTAEKRRFPILDLMQHVCPTQTCVVESEGKPIRPDGLHFDGAGTEETARWVLGELQRIVKATR